jgi:hypothetical protein
MRRAWHRFCWHLEVWWRQHLPNRNHDPDTCPFCGGGELL